jgi:hypothetical protein
MTGSAADGSAQARHQAASPCAAAGPPRGGVPRAQISRLAIDTGRRRPGRSVAGRRAADTSGCPRRATTQARSLICRAPRLFLEVGTQGVMGWLMTVSLRGTRPSLSYNFPSRVAAGQGGNLIPCALRGHPSGTQEADADSQACGGPCGWTLRQEGRGRACLAEHDVVGHVGQVEQVGRPDLRDVAAPRLGFERVAVLESVQPGC